MSYQALADAQLTTENAPQQLQSSDGHLTGLCEHCIKIMDFLKHYLDAGAFGTVDSFDPVLSLPLQRSYECSVCSVILGDVPFEDFSAEHTADTPIVELEPIDAGKLGVGVYVSSLRQNVIDPTIPKKRGMYTSRALLRHSQKRRRYKMEASTNSLSTWKLAQSWLADCSDTHTCMSKIQKKLPTRLAHVGEENSQPRLVELNRDCAYEYCTLSHCWGKTEMLVLKRSNYIDFLKHIPVELLTQTFQDAFFTAKKLDFRYIWIDSLCIIQDDPEDWAKEAGTMSDVYSNTSLNIAATSGTDGSAGLFHDRKLHLVRFPEVVPSSENQTTSKSQQGNLSDDTQPSRYLLVNEALWNEEITASCLASRGWVVQELYLAPRTLHFGRDQIFWECRSCRQAESFFDAGLDVSQGPHSKNQQWALHSAMFGDEDKDLRSIAMDVWRSVVERYSETNLTEEKDKLIVIAGIAKSLHHVTKDEYLAGMWREDLERNLLWSTKIGEIWRLGSDRPVMEPRKPADYRAPSWSWASVDGQIKIDHHIYPWRKYMTKIRIIHCATTPAKGWNMYGQILGGHLILKCHQLKKLKDIPFLMDQKRLSQATFHFDELADDVLQTTKPFESDFDIYLLLCMVSVEEYHLQQNLHGMLLKSISETGEHGLYERMGVFKLEGTTDGFLSFPGTEDSEAYLEDPPADPQRQEYRIKLV